VSLGEQGVVGLGRVVVESARGTPGVCRALQAKAKAPGLALPGPSHNLQITSGP
jgi:hypothetical protein